VQQHEIIEQFWKSLKSDRTVMLGYDDPGGGESQPMTALLEDNTGGPIWIFTSTDTVLAQKLAPGKPALMHFSSKDHQIFACITGSLHPHNERAMIDRLWSPFVAAWYEGGKNDPKLLLMRFDAVHARIWENETSLLAGLKLLLGSDPKQDFKDKIVDAEL
jgi:general stress protein 26